MKYNQYDIVLVNLDPTIGVEICKTRPCVIISPDEMNHNIQTLIIAPMTSKSRQYPTRVTVAKDSYIILDQIKTIDKKRVVKKLSSLATKEITQIKQILQNMLVDW